MKVVSTVSFNKDVARIKDKRVAGRIESVLKKLESVKSLSEVAGVKKMAGAQNAYRIRIGDYRLGFYLIHETIQLTIFANRKDIYGNFP